MFENKKIKDVHATRYIVSWLKAGGKLYYGEDIDNFHDWLLSMGLEKDKADHIMYMAMCGKLELEVNAKKFIKDNGI